MDFRDLTVKEYDDICRGDQWEGKAEFSEKVRSLPAYTGFATACVTLTGGDTRCKMVTRARTLGKSNGYKISATCLDGTVYVVRRDG